MSFRLDEFELQLIRECPGLIRDLGASGLNPFKLAYITERDARRRIELLKGGIAETIGSTPTEGKLLRAALQYAKDKRYPAQPHGRSYDGEPRNLLGKQALARIDAECLMLEAEELRLIGAKNRAKAAGMKHSSADLAYSLGLKKAAHSSRFLDRVIKEYMGHGAKGLELRWIVNYEIESLGNSLKLESAEIRALEAQALAQIMQVENSTAQSETAPVEGAVISKTHSQNQVSGKQVYSEAGVSRATFQSWKAGKRIKRENKVRIEQAARALNYSK